MDVREKLVDLIIDAKRTDPETGSFTEYLADYLTSNGVTVQENVKMSDELLKQLKNAPITICKEESSIETVQEWIPVKDRLPTREDANETESILAINKDEKYVGRWVWDIVARWPTEFTYWMPMPQPPKGE